MLAKPIAFLAYSLRKPRPVRFKREEVPYVLIEKLNQGRELGIQREQITIPGTWASLLRWSISPIRPSAQ
eukprot:11212246-Lingulodinium_polyedra.AAC.1